MSLEKVTAAQNICEYFSRPSSVMRGWQLGYKWGVERGKQMNLKEKSVVKCQQCLIAWLTDCLDR